jgi:hypothetical protein
MLENAGFILQKRKWTDLPGNSVPFMKLFALCDHPVSKRVQQNAKTGPGLHHLFFENKNPIPLNLLTIYLIEMIRIYEIHGAFPLLWRKLI